MIPAMHPVPGLIPGEKLEVLSELLHVTRETQGWRNRHVHIEALGSAACVASQSTRNPHV